MKCDKTWTFQKKTKKTSTDVDSCFAFNHFIEKVFQIYFGHNIQYITIHCVKH